MKRVIQGKEYDFKEERISISDLRFWPDNPRVYTDVYEGLFAKMDSHGLSDDELQLKIYNKLKGKENIRQLRDQIESSGGLAEPLIVQKQTNKPTNKYFYAVIEGNRRLAACKMIKETSKDNTKLAEDFSRIPCEVVPSNIHRSHIFSLLGILHIEGKLQWTPFDKAHYVKNRADSLHKERGTAENSISIIAKELGVTTKEAEMYIRNIDLMKEAKEKEKTKYSIYDVANRNRVIKEHLKEGGPKKKVWIGVLKNWPEKKPATEFRAAVGSLTRNRSRSNKHLNDFLKGVATLEEAAHRAESEGKIDTICHQVNKLRESINANRRHIEILDPTDPILNELAYEFSKLKPLVDRIYEKLEDKRNG